MIKKIIIDLGGKEIEMTFEEAEKLYAVLKIMFEKKETTYIPWPLNPYVYPRVWYTNGTTYTATLNGDNNSTLNLG